MVRAKYTSYPIEYIEENEKREEMEVEEDDDEEKEELLRDYMEYVLQLTDAIMKNDKSMIQKCVRVLSGLVEDTRNILPT